MKRLTSVLLAVFAPLSLSAAELTSADVHLTEVAIGTFLAFETKKWPRDAHNVWFTIEGPKEFYASVAVGNKPPELNLAKLGELADGEYFYEITGGTEDLIKAEEELDNGRDGKDQGAAMARSFNVGGRLLIKGGVIVTFQQGVETGSEKTEEGKEIDDSDEGSKG